MTSLEVSPGERQEVVQLPSLAVMDALRATFALYRRHFLTFALVMGIGALATTTLSIPAETWALDKPSIQPAGQSPSGITEVVRQLIRVIAQNSVLGFLAEIPNRLAAGAAIFLTAQLLLGRGVSIGAAYREAFHRLGYLLLSDIALTAIILGLAVTCVGILALPFVLLGLEFAGQVIVLERLGPVSAIRRSWQLSKGHRIRILLCVLAVSLPSWLAYSSVYYPLHWWTGVSDDDSPLRAVGGLFVADPTSQLVWTLDKVTLSLVTTLLWPLYSILTTILYLDLRARERPYQMPTRPSPGPS